MMEEKINQLLDLRQRALEGGGADKIRKRHEKGLLTARERIELLVDEGSFEEFDMLKVHRCPRFRDG